MIDIHTHLIPNIDDGSNSMELSISIIETASKCGVTDIIATPHFIFGSCYNIDNVNKKRQFNKLRDACKRRKLKVNLYLGNEIFIDENIVSLIENGKACSLNNSKYVLFELPRNNNYMALKEVIYELSMHDYIPILAHPERYLFLKEDPTRIYELFDMEVLFQCNIGSFFGDYGKEAKYLVELLVKHKFVSFLSSDVHKGPNVYDYINPLKEQLSKIISNDEINALFINNAKQVLNNKTIKRDEYIPFKKTLFGKYK